MWFMGQFTYHISLKHYKETVKQWRRKPSHHFAHVNNDQIFRLRVADDPSGETDCSTNGIKA